MGDKIQWLNNQCSLELSNWYSNWIVSQLESHSQREKITQLEMGQSSTAPHSYSFRVTQRIPIPQFSSHCWVTEKSTRKSWSSTVLPTVWQSLNSVTALSRLTVLESLSLLCLSCCHAQRLLGTYLRVSVSRMLSSLISCSSRRQRRQSMGEPYHCKWEEEDRA